MKRAEIKARDKKLKRSRENGAPHRIKLEVKFGEDEASSEGGSAKGKFAMTTPKKVRKIKKRPNRISIFASKLGKTQLFVSGRDGVKALAIISKTAAISDVKITKDGVMFDAPSKVLGKIVALLDNLCYDYKIIRRRGAAPALVGALMRVGAIVGLIAAIALVAIYPNFITRVSIVGIGGDSVDGALNAKVQGILSEHGIREGAFNAKADPDEISKRILGLDGVAYAAFERHGTHVKVLIKRELEGESFIGISGSVVRATTRASVTRVIVEGGTAAVKYGDVVESGDALIEGYVTYGDDRIPVEAKGSVYGLVQFTSEAVFPDVALEKRYGEVKKVVKLAMFGKTPKPPKAPFDCYELRTERTKFGLLIPFDVCLYEFRQLVVSEKEEVRGDDELIEKVYSDIIASIPYEASVKQAINSVRRVDGARVVKVTLEVETLISSR